MKEKGITIAISNQKGGEGKTTLSLYLAEAFSESKKVLLIDWDAQANITQLFKNEVPHSIFHTLGYRGEKKVEIKEILIPLKKNLDLAPSSIHLANFNTPFERDDFDLLKDVLEEVKNKYEIIIIDCPPSLGLILENALIAADYILVPIQTRIFSVQGLNDLHFSIKKIQKKANSKLKLLGAILNIYEDARALSGLAENVKKYFPVFNTVIPRRESIPQAQAKKMFLNDYDPKTMKIFLDLSNEIQEVLKNE